MNNADTFFESLERASKSRGFVPKRVTATGWDVFRASANGRRIAVTVNHARNDDRVSVKLTIARAERGGATPLFDAVRDRFEDGDSIPGARWDA
jgi:hypothetical protein